MGWVPGWGSLWMVFSSVSGPNFVSLTPSMGILFFILRRSKVSTLWSSFFLSFMHFANCILDILSFWVNICLSVSAYHVCSFVIGLPHSGGYPPGPSICLLFFLKICLFNLYSNTLSLFPDTPEEGIRSHYRWL